MLTIGQYLQPTEYHLPVLRHVHPDGFAVFEQAHAAGVQLELLRIVMAQPAEPDTLADEHAVEGIERAAEKQSFVRGKPGAGQGIERLEQDYV